MYAILLAAGRGSRLKDLTSERPKCFVEVDGRPLVEWQLESLRKAGLDEISIVTGYRGDRFAGVPARLVPNPHWERTNMVRSLACCADLLRREPSVVSYSDILYGPATVAALIDGPGALCLTYDRQWRTLWQRRSDDPLSDTETFRIDSDGRIREIGNRPTTLDEVQGQYMGLLRFTPESWGWVENQLAALGSEADRLSMTGMLSRLIAAHHPLYGIGIEGDWIEIDCESDLRLAEAMRKEGLLPLR